LPSEVTTDVILNLDQDRVYGTGHITARNREPQEPSFTGWTLHADAIASQTHR
jgi:hypothetical protein